MSSVINTSWGNFYEGQQVEYVVWQGEMIGPIPGVVERDLQSENEYEEEYLTEFPNVRGLHIKIDRAAYLDRFSTEFSEETTGMADSIPFDGPYDLKPGRGVLDEKYAKHPF